MIEHKWKLGEDIHPKDCILDPITFEQVIDALHCGERVIDGKSLRKVAKEILDSRMEDFYFLILNNADEIIAEAKKGRN